MNPADVEKLFKGIPRKNICFLPTPLHKLENISRIYGVDIYMKRDDLTGPNPFGGNKTRKLEFIIASALQENIEYIISSGGYQSNSSMQLVAFCRIFGIKPILYLADVINQGVPDEYKGNLLLNKIMGSEINFVLKDYEGPDISPLWDKMKYLCDIRKKELQNKGYKVRVLPSGVVDPEGLISYVLAFKEVFEQGERNGLLFDHLYHTTGTGGSLPGLIAGKIMLDSDVKITSIACNPYGPDDICNEDIIFERTETVFKQLNVEIPDRSKILNEIHIDQNYFGEGYGIPTDDATLAIRELAREEGIFIDPVYTGKGFAGLLDHIRKGKIPPGSKVVFLHTGGSGALFSEVGLTGALTEN